MFDIMEQHSEEAVIKVIGVGGGGGNAVEHMVKQQIEGVRLLPRIQMHKHYASLQLM